MRYDRRAAVDDWKILELVHKHNGKRPCSDEYADRANDAELNQIFGELRKLRASGYPPQPERGIPNVQQWSLKCPDDHRNTTFHVLKAKPSGWRLYFYLRDAMRREVEFLYAVHKKGDARDPADFKHLCHLLRRLNAGTYELAQLHIPDR
jgi:hypothetical protein